MNVQKTSLQYAHNLNNLVKYKLPSMVANRKLFPVGHESVVFAPEHGSHIGCVRDGGIEICVVSDMAWQMHLKSQHKLNLDTGNSISLSSSGFFSPIFAKLKAI